MLRRMFAAPLLIAALVLGACGDDDDTPDASTGGQGDGDLEAGLTVAASFFPIETIVRAIGGDSVRVVPLVPPGQEVHDFEPTPEQVSELEGADAIFSLGDDFQPGVQDAIGSLPSDVQSVDLLVGLSLLTLDEGVDPHAWLDPTNMAAMGEAVAATLTELDPERAAEFDANAAAFRADMEALDREIGGQLDECAARTLVTTHRAFEYFARRYDLVQLPIAGISPSEEPSAKDLEAIAEAAREHGVTTIFFEENLPDDLARTVADEIGADVAVLDPLESLSRDQLDAGETYRSVMLANAAALAQGLGCS